MTRTADVGLAVTILGVLWSPILWWYTGVGAALVALGVASFGFVMLVAGVEDADEEAPST